MFKKYFWNLYQIWQKKNHTWAKSHFMSTTSTNFNVLAFMWVFFVKMWLLWKMGFWKFQFQFREKFEIREKYEFREKWACEKIEIVIYKMWISLKSDFLDQLIIVDFCHTVKFFFLSSVFLSFLSTFQSDILIRWPGYHLQKLQS